MINNKNSKIVLKVNNYVRKLLQKIPLQYNME